MLKVKSRTGESVQQMIWDMKRVAYYEKPSEKNRRRMRRAQRTTSPEM